MEDEMFYVVGGLAVLSVIVILIGCIIEGRREREREEEFWREQRRRR